MALREVQTCAGCGAPASGSSCDYCKARFTRDDEYERYAGEAMGCITSATGIYPMMMCSASPRGRLKW